MKFIGTFFDLCKRLIKNGGMESVTSLPTTNNFEGREVNYKGTKYIYYNGAWVSQRDAEKLGGLDSFFYVSNPKETVIGKSSYEIYGESVLLSKSYIDNLYSPLMFASPNNFTIEYSDDGEVFTEIEKTDPVYNIRFYLNSSYYIKFTTHPYYRITVPFNATVPIRGVFYGLVLSGWNYYIDRCLIEELQGEVWNIIADEQQNNYTQDYYAVEFKSHYLYSQINSRNYCQSLRVTLKGRHISNNTSYGVTGIALLSNYYKALSGIRNYFRPTNGILTSPFSLDSQETLNYDVNNIKPTQTGTVKKSSSWIWQYLVQSVNWLRDNFNNFLSKRMYEHVYTNCAYLNIKTQTTGAIILKTPFQNIDDVNNSMTYIELSVISHKNPTSVAKYIFYLYKYKPDVSSFEQKYYSVLGPQIFSNIYIGALQDNSTVIVLGDFTDTYTHFTVSIDRIVTSFNRTSDDTDKFSLYVESDESVLQYKAKFNLQSAFAKGYSVPDGTDSQFLKADGSIDNNEYAPKSHTHNGTDSENIDYNNLENKPDIPEVGNGTITIKQGTNTIGSFTTNQSANKTITLPENSDLPIASDTVLGGIKSSGSISVDPATGVAKVLNNSHNHTASNITGLSTVATTGDYADLSGKPTIPTVGSGTVTIKQGGVTKGTINVNQTNNTEINLDAGGSYTLPIATTSRLGGIKQGDGLSITSTTGVTKVVNRWNLNNANPEVSAIEIELASSTDSIFGKLVEEGNDPFSSRVIIANVANGVIQLDNLFAGLNDLTELNNCPEYIRYHIYIYSDHLCKYRLNDGVYYNVPIKSSNGVFIPYLIKAGQCIKIEFIRMSYGGTYDGHDFIYFADIENPDSNITTSNIGTINVNNASGWYDPTITEYIIDAKDNPDWLAELFGETKTPIRVNDIVSNIDLSIINIDSSFTDLLRKKYKDITNDSLRSFMANIRTGGEYYYYVENDILDIVNNEATYKLKLHIDNLGIRKEYVLEAYRGI